MEITVSQPILALWDYLKTLQLQFIESLSGSTNQYVLIMITKLAITITVLLRGHQGTNTESWEVRYGITISQPILDLWDCQTLQ